MLSTVAIWKFKIFGEIWTGDILGAVCIKAVFKQPQEVAKSSVRPKKKKKRLQDSLKHSKCAVREENQ